MAAVALGFTACDDSSDLGKIQTSPQLDIMSANGVTVRLSDEAKAGINLETTAADAVPVVVLDSVTALPGNALVAFDMQIADNEGFENYNTLSTTQDGNVYSVDRQDFEDAMVAMYHNSPVAQKPYVRFVGYVLEGKQKSLLGGEGFYYLTNQITVTPIDMKLDVENAYYLGGTAGNLKMEHSDLHPYDDPVFVALFDVTADQAAAGYKWQIVPESQVANANPAECYGPSSTTTLEKGAEGLITAAGKYRISVNMLEKTYTLTYAFEVLYTPGSGNGWSQTASQCLYTNDYTNYYGVTITGAEGEAQGEFKLDASTDWSMNWGLDNGILTPGGANIVTVPAGLWWVSANLNDLTMSMFHVESVGVIGLNSNWDTDVDMTSSNNGLEWSATITADSDTEFKFRFNHAWDANLGGSPEKLEFNGANIALAAGTYKVVLNMTSTPYTCTIIKQ